MQYFKKLGMDNVYKDLKQFGRVKLNENLAKHTTFKIGGVSRYFVIVSEYDNIVGLLKYITEQGIEYFVLGGGSNILFCNDFDGVAIKINTNKIDVKQGQIVVDAGVLLNTVVINASQHGLTGMEWAVGIPGSIGGAVRGNAGAFGEDISDSLSKVEVFRNGEVIELKKDECDFSYRNSIFKSNGDIVLRVHIVLKSGDKKETVKKMTELMQYRSNRFAPFPSAGSFFKNLPLDVWKHDKKDLPPKFLEVNKIAAGWLIDQCDLRGYVVGGSKVSDEHANFIINYDKASFEDVLKVVEEVKNRVYNKFGIDLEEEVSIINQ